MNIKKIAFLCCLPAVFCINARAQSSKDSVIKGQTIQITQIYQPQVEQPAKPVLIPELPAPDTTKQQFQYTVPQQTLSYTYHSVPIRPLALGKQAELIPFQNYVKAGIGNRSSLYIDAGIGSLKGEKYQTAFHISHLNQKGSIANQKAGYTLFDGSGSFDAAGQVFNAALSVRNRRIRFYGYDNELYQYGSGALQQSLTDGALTIDMRNAQPNAAHINYHPEVTLGMFGDNFSAHEKRLSFNLPVEYAFGADSNHSRINGKLSLGIFGNLVHFENTQAKSGNNLLKINPALDLTVQNTDFHIGLSPALGKDRFYLLPDLSIQTRLLQNHLKVSAGWKADVLQNTYLDLSLFNPFIDNVFTIHQTKLDQVFAGFESTAGKFVTFGGTISWRQWSNLPLFINNYAVNPDGKMFQVTFADEVQAFNLEAFIRYQPSTVIGLSARGSWFNFYKKTAEEVWGYPAFRLDGLVDLHPLKKLYAHAGVTLMDGIYARRADGLSERLPSIFDVNVAGEYNIIPRFSLFLQANNLLNRKYQRWNQYQVLGINIIGGFRFKF